MGVGEIHGRSEACLAVLSPRLRSATCAGLAVHTRLRMDGGCGPPPPTPTVTRQDLAMKGRPILTGDMIENGFPAHARGRSYPQSGTKMTGDRPTGVNSGAIYDLAAIK